MLRRETSWIRLVILPTYSNSELNVLRKLDVDIFLTRTLGHCSNSSDNRKLTKLIIGILGEIVTVMIIFYLLLTLSLGMSQFLPGLCFLGACVGGAGGATD